MAGKQLCEKLMLASDGRLWKERAFAHRVYTCKKHDVVGGMFRYHIDQAYEKRDGSFFRALAEAFEQRGEVDPIRSYCFQKMLCRRPGELPTRAQLVRELIQLGFKERGLRRAVERACDDSELTIPKGKAGRPRSRR